MPAVRRNRHGTSGSGQPEGRETNSSTYGTRSKRKASDMNSSDASSSDQKTSTNSSQSATSEAGSNAPPAKKTRRSSDTPQTPPPQTPEPDNEPGDENTQEIPGVVIDPPNSSSPDSFEDLPRNKTAAPPVRGGFGRARGRGRGRGRWGWNRGGRGGSGLGARGTPVAETSPSANKSLRGRGGHRVKKSDNARIQALYHRRAALKHQYKQVAQIQKTALLAISEKSLDAIKADRTYHKSLPEYKDTTRGITDLYQKRMDKLTSEYQTRKAYLQAQWDKNQEYEHSKYNDAIELIEEVNEAKFKQNVLHVYRQWSTHGSIGSTPLYRDPENKIVKRVVPPPTIVHSIATPYSFVLAEVNDPSIREQHPRSHWEDMTPVQRADWERKLDKAGGDGKRIKNSKGSALYQPQDAVVDDVDTPNALGDLVSALATPAGESTEDTDSEDSENAEEQPTDQYGVKVPKKPTPRNGEAPQNRIVCDPPVVFDQDEIGIRKHYVRKNNRNEHQYLGMDPDPNPKKVYYDQVARGYNSARNKKEDLDQDITRDFKIHPTYGLPLPSSENPDYDECDSPSFAPPTDWSKPLEPTNPTIIIEETPKTKKLLDEDKETFLTSRSEWIARANAEWDELDPKFKMTAALEQIDALECPPRPPTPPRVKEMLRRKAREVAKAEEKRKQKEVEDEVIDPQLLTAINEAESKRSFEASEAIKPPPAMPAAPQRSYGYDPVRDTGYQTPYQPTTPSAPTMAPPIGPRPEKLDALADAALTAEIRGSMPPPSAYRIPINHWAPPAPYHRAPPTPTTTFLPYPGPSGAPIAPILGAQYTSPRIAPAPGVPGSYRELRPAPPQNRTSLPQPPAPQAARAWYPGYP